MEQKKYFTLAEANALIPSLEFKLPKLLQIKQELTVLVTQLVRKGIKVEELFAMTELDDDLVQAKARLESLGSTLQEYLMDIQSQGLVVKDMDLGLIDFLGKMGEEDVYFCWQLGEKEVRYWHKLDEGYSQRHSFGEDEESPVDRMLH